jgi:HD-GYP domain-containing protein (c-di-GMP phosphodiesterase class II)
VADSHLFLMSSELERLARELEELNRIGAALSQERDVDRLLDLILTKAREITSSDAGSLYLVEPDGSSLRFVIAQNASIDVPFRSTTLELTDRSIAGYVALRGEPIRLDDAYSIPAGVPLAFDRRFDAATGYRTCSVLAVPMRTPTGVTIGVLQLINATTDGHVAPYTDRQQELALSLASQAAVAVENRRLYGEIQDLFEGFVRASVVAIESRDPATSGHSFRVANLTVALAEAADRADGGPFTNLRFTREEMRTIRYASLLHDFGKVGVREDVLVKVKKLYPAQLELVRERFALARRSREVASLQQRLDYLLANGRDAYIDRLPLFESAFSEDVDELERYLASVEAANEPSLIGDDRFERLREIAAVEFVDPGGAARTLLAEDEVRLLSIRKGSLSDTERVQIESHVVHTYQFLTQIPWTKEIGRIPAIAVGHHEKLNGLGYPNRLSAPDIPVQTRMMTISDIFDALSAADRPYKKAVPIERALDILDFAVKDGEIDADLFRLFVEARIFDRWQVEPFPY